MNDAGDEPERQLRPILDDAPLMYDSSSGSNADEPPPSQSSRDPFADLRPCPG
jgi:hypothetical protein